MSSRAYRGHQVAAEPSLVEPGQYVALVDGDEVGTASSSLAALDVAKAWARRHDPHRPRRERVEIVDDDYMLGLRDLLRAE